MAQLAQLQKLLNVTNKGSIKIKKACIGKVEEVQNIFHLNSLHYIIFNLQIYNFIQFNNKI